MAPAHRLIALTAVTLAALATLVTNTAPAGASAEGGFTFWGYYHLRNGTWEASQEGAGSITPREGVVEGFRYATTTETEFNRPPRVDTSFAEICGDAEAPDGRKRVALVIDYGTVEDAANGGKPPPAEGHCAVVPEGFSTQQALESVASLRIEDFICAINGYPETGCGEQVSNVQIPADEPTVALQLDSDASNADDGAAVAAEESESGVPWSLIGVAVLVVLLAVVAVMLARRRRA